MRKMNKWENYLKDPALLLARFSKWSPSTTQKAVGKLITDYILGYEPRGMNFDLRTTREAFFVYLYLYVYLLCLSMCKKAWLTLVSLVSPVTVVV